MGMMAKIAARRLVFLAVLFGLLIGAGVLVWPQSDRQSRTEAADLMASLDLAPGASVAEIGAGEGDLAAAVAQLLGGSGRLFVTEISERSLADLRARFTEEQPSQVTVVHGAEESTNLPPGCCDAIYMRLVYHHFTEPEAMTADLFRVLRPGGRLAVIEFPPRGRRGRNATGTGGHGIASEELQSRLAGAGFRIERTAAPWRGRNYIVIASKPAESDPVR
jgi:ubiquinone/menaquinone biosynthesis C-methylase UbiE